MDVLQWNMGFTGAEEPVIERRSRVLAALLNERRPSIVALQEANDPKVDGVLRGSGYDLEQRDGLAVAHRGDEWLRIGVPPVTYGRALVVEFDAVDVISGRPSKLLVANIHLPSRLHASDSRRLNDLNTFLLEFYEVRRQTGLVAAELVLGDFNLEPYHDALMLKSGLWGSRSLRFVRDREGKKTPNRRPLFNPSWQLLGLCEGAMGTYYYSGEDDGPWYVFDQALISAELATGGAPQLRPVTQAAGTTLASRIVGQPDRGVGSDHFPIIWSFQLASSVAA